MADLNSIGGIHYEMMRRCYNRNSIAYKDYGAKGISVCEEWHSRDDFRKWALENGYEKGMRLERIDTAEDYDPKNCVFGERQRKRTGIAEYTRKVKEHREQMKEFAGIEGKYSNTRLYRIYIGMHTRCENPANPKYENYGGRGIGICDEWSGSDGFFFFYKWAMGNGYNKKLSIDRIDNDKGYSPENCRWATAKAQIENRRVARIYLFHGKYMPLAEIAAETGIKYGLLYNRVVQKGMTIEKAITDTGWVK